MTKSKQNETFPWFKFESEKGDCEDFDTVSDRSILGYFVKARIHQLKEFYDFDLSDEAKRRHFGWVVSKHEIAYLRMVNPKEKLVIRSRLISVGSSKMLLENLLLNESESLLMAVLWSTYVPIHLSTKEIAEHSHEVRAFFEKRVWELPEDQRNDFDRRLETLKKQKKFD